MEMNEEKRGKFIESAGKRVNNVIHDIQILEPMARSSVYDFSKDDVEQMFTAMQETLDNVRDSYYKKFEEKAKTEKKVFTFGSAYAMPKVNTEVKNEISDATHVETTGATEVADVMETVDMPQEIAQNEEVIDDSFETISDFSVEQLDGEIATQEGNIF